MKLAISNIAWHPHEESEIARNLKVWGCDAVEVAPSRLWPDFRAADLNQVRDYKKFWKGNGLEIAAIQALLFGKPELVIFGTKEVRDETESYLKRSIEIARELGARVLVFGAPKNRARGVMPIDRAMEIAVDFFGRIGEAANRAGVCFCIEPNPKTYGCDFVTTSAEGEELVKKVGSPGFKLHLDLAGMSLSNEDIQSQLAHLAPQIAHFHLSAPQLDRPSESTGIDYRSAVAWMDQSGYEGYTSIEMRAQPEGNVSAVEETLRFARSLEA
jgi:sugar phosphate isomerase/epimerase